MAQTSSQISTVRWRSRRPDARRNHLRSVTWLAGAYTVICIGASALPLPFPRREPPWLASSAVCLVLAGQLARGRTGPRWLLIGCGWLLVTSALVLVFVVGDPLGLLGAVFTVPMLALVTGTVSPRGKKALVATHVVFPAAGWASGSSW